VRVDLHDMPAIEEVAGRPATNAPLLAAIIARAHASIVYCEFVASRPTDARVAAFAFGRARGVIEGVVGALGIPIKFLTPATWKRLAEIAPGVENKDQARARAIAKWPAHAELFARKKDCDRAESALIGWAGPQRESSR
jgi:crossover junction endodeoxyribonuclease RuvC